MSSLFASRQMLSRIEVAKLDADDCLRPENAAQNNGRREVEQLTRVCRELDLRAIEIQDEISQLEQQKNSRAATQHAEQVRELLHRQTQTGGYRLLGAALGIWLACIVFLYAVLAAPVSGWSVDQSSTNLSQAVFKMRDYLSRVTGTVPQVCVADRKTTTPAKSDARDFAGTPLLVGALGGGDASRDEFCSWRRKSLSSGGGDSIWMHLLAALSPDVGTIQKVTLLFLIIALVELAQISRERVLAARVIADPAYPNGVATSSDQKEEISLFPRRRLALATADDRDDPYLEVCARIQAKRNELKTNTKHAATMLARVLDYIGDIYVAGLTTERVDALAERTDRLESNYREHLYDRFWRVDYWVWLLPTVGFLGTIYGISLALVEAKGIFESSTSRARPTLPVDNAGAGSAPPKAPTDEFGQVVDALGTAFDTTALALFLVAILIWLQKREEARVREFGEDSARAVQQKLIASLRNRSAKSDAALLRECSQLTRALAPPAAVVAADGGGEED